MKRFAFLTSALSLPLIALFAAGPAVAQEEDSAQAGSSAPLEEILVVGSRRRDRSAADSPVPVDVISGDQFRAHGDSDMDALLAAMVPSYNVAQEPISDAATFIRPATLRSLPPDATLVLVNGKRRHRAAVIALLGAGVSGGSQGPDLSAIPAIALDRLEVLRDGASAQYGSDAIAGIMNFVLKSDAEGAVFDAKWGTHFEGDGDAVTLAGNVGLPLAGSGFVNLSLEWKEADPTSRSAQRGDAQGLIDAGNTQVRQPAAQIWGAPEISDDIKFFANLGAEMGGGSEFYAFGNWAKRQVEGGFYYRNPHTRGGVFRGPVLEDGTPTVKVADLSGDGTGNCPVVRIVNNVPDSAALAQIANDPNCYSLIERFPGGFTPQFGGYVHDTSVAGGIRGEWRNDWRYDFSVVAGRSNAQFYIYNTINPQLLAQRNDIDTYYEAGAYTETDRVVNFDLARTYDLGFAGPVNVALGVEWRDENFKIESGEPNSWFIDPNLEFGLASQGFGVGSNGFPGFQPGDAGESSISAKAAYVDLESDITDQLLLGAALRFEDYSEYGDTLDGKVAARFQVNDMFAIRGAASTGFRVPTAGQANLRNVTTEFQSGMLADIATLPPTNPVAQQKGAVPLTPEESVNLTLGAVFNVGDLDVTIDYYSIEIKDRIAFTSRFSLTPEDISALLAAGVTDATSFSSVRFFSNQQTVEASGIDLVATYPFDLGSGSSSLTVVGNWSDIELAKFDPEFTSDNRRLQIEQGRPDVRFTATFTHLQGPWRFMARARYYGEYYDAPTNDASVSFYPDTSILVDAEVGWDVREDFSVLVGVQNLFDEYPSTNPNGEVAGLIYPEQSPFGFNGGYYYVRGTWRPGFMD
ncbi:MAG: TonB-dependent receptor [Gammaproteobacteria bacterium]|nr:TonB-dependent receptor [Gammaproteobacteria bacterium]MCY4165421.1 TonB-dependent receptor [Gammaproteobacteria bacterium]MCY4255657.1 TonB-dependent receptor [Gammaproteobacteria bacterium]MCY4339755.1 TonB-dependent receptor [Gammaproteobacteria bacterium]